MNKTQVLSLLEANQNERGIAHWKRLGYGGGKMKSFGIGLTQLRKLAKQVGRDHDLALKLWKSNVYDAKVIALLIDDPKAITPEQAESQVEEVGVGLLSHVFSSCDATLSKTPFVKELADQWMTSRDPVRRECGYGLLYEISKNHKKTAPDESYFLDRIQHIDKAFDTEKKSVKGCMGGALMGIGKRSRKLNAAALKVARRLGPIEFETDGDHCEPLDVVKHLTSDYIRKKLGT